MLYFHLYLYWHILAHICTLHRRCTRWMRSPTFSPSNGFRSPHRCFARTLCPRFLYPSNFSCPDFIFIFLRMFPAMMVAPPKAAIFSLLLACLLWAPSGMSQVLTHSLVTELKTQTLPPPSGRDLQKFKYCVVVC